MVQLKEVLPSIPSEKKSNSPEYTDGFCDRCKLETKVTKCNDTLLRCVECRQRYINMKRLDKAKKIIPPKFWGLKTQKPQFEEYKSNPKSLFIWGAKGTGKTTFVCNLIREYVLQKIEVKFISFPAFIMELQEAFKIEHANPYEIARKIAKFQGVLCIDDIGAEKTTDFVRQIVYYIINEREMYLLTTIITSNFSLQEIDTQIDSRVSSRIEGMSEKILHFVGEDKRLAKHDKLIKEGEKCPTNEPVQNVRKR